MTSSRDPNPYADLIAVDDPLSLALATDLEAAYAATVPALAFDPAARRAGQQSRPGVRHWRTLAVGVAAAAILGAAILVSASWGGKTETVSAEEILANARAAAESPAGYHRTYRQTYHGGSNPGVPHQIVVVETWYRDPGHHRTEFRDGAGNLLRGTILNGDEGWHYFSDGILRVIHFGPNSTFVQDLRKGLAPAESLEAMLGQLGGCDTQPAITGESSVVDRPVHIVENCGLRLWIDQESFFVLGWVRRASEPSPSPAPTIAGEVNIDLHDFTIETMTFDWDVEVPDATFGYQPPPGTFVVEQDF